MLFIFSPHCFDILHVGFVFDLPLENGFGLYGQYSILGLYVELYWCGGLGYSLNNNH